VTAWGFLSLLGWIASRIRPAPRSGIGPLVHPDCTVTVRRRFRTTEYELLGGYVLRRRGGHVEYQFYFGLLLLEWLYE
jgi:hypothetical protein